MSKNSKQVFRNGKKTLYQNGYNGIYYKNKNNRLIMRGVNTGDAEFIVSAQTISLDIMKKSLGIKFNSKSCLQENKTKLRDQNLKGVIEEIKLLQEEDITNMILIIESKKNNPIAYVEIQSIVEVSSFAIAKIIYKADLYQSYEDRIISTLKEMCEKFSVYDVLGLSKNSKVVSIIYIHPSLTDLEIEVEKL